jgi:hypothetical protein
MIPALTHMPALTLDQLMKIVGGVNEAMDELILEWLQGQEPGARKFAIMRLYGAGILSSQDVTHLFGRWGLHHA